MKYCYECGRITAGEPIFCTFCGRSYDVKLCQRLHANPRYAEVCAQCGSRDFSTPQPKVSFLWRIFAFLLRVFLGILLVYVSLVLLKELLIELLQEPYVQQGLIGLGLLLIALWVMWSMIPDWMRKVIHHAVKRKEGRHRDQ
jgi:RNA polymerase subunit RPABC4/transcription elongation factor Spt4